MARERGHKGFKARHIRQRRKIPGMRWRSRCSDHRGRRVKLLLGELLAEDVIALEVGRALELWEHGKVR